MNITTIEDVVREFEKEFPTLQREFRHAIARDFGRHPTEEEDVLFFIDKLKATLRTLIENVRAEIAAGKLNLSDRDAYGSGQGRFNAAKDEDLAILTRVRGEI